VTLCLPSQVVHVVAVVCAVILVCCIVVEAIIATFGILYHLLVAAELRSSALSPAQGEGG
jgi:hypothetical protein